MYSYPKHIKNKIVSVKELLEKLSGLRKNKKVALCHGTFDIVHPGHIRHLTYAKLKSDILISGNSSKDGLVNIKSSVNLAFFGLA